MSADISWIERGRKHLEIFIYINVPVRKNCQKKFSIKFKFTNCSLSFEIQIGLILLIFIGLYLCEFLLDSYNINTAFCFRLLVHLSKSI